MTDDDAWTAITAKAREAANTLGVSEFWDAVDCLEGASGRMVRNVVTSVLVAIIEIQEESAA